MIKKDAGQPKIHRLRIIHLFEADYNFFLKLQWGHRLVRHAVPLYNLHATIGLHAKALQLIKYTVKTMHRVSDTNYHGIAFVPLFGTGQGSGVSLAVWQTFCGPFFYSFDSLIPHQMNFVPISWARKHLRSSDTFDVDDTLVGFTSCDDTSYSSLLISRLQDVAQTWEKLLFLSGGKLTLNKCSWYILRWE